MDESATTTRADGSHGRVEGAKPGRLVSLDVFRGLTIAAMLLVNNPGDWGHVYWPLEHAAWHGCTPTDLIFPFFLFIVGMSMSVSTRWREPDAARWWRPYWRVLRRAMILFGLGLTLAVVPRVFLPGFDVGQVRVMGVLQRIGVCYWIAGWVLISAGSGGWGARRTWVVRAIIAALLIGPTALMRWVPVPSESGIELAKFGAWSIEGNWVGWIDRAVLGASHLYKKPEAGGGGAMLGFDPEGLLSTLPAAAQVLIGAGVGAALMAGVRGLGAGAARSVIRPLLARGAVLLALGWSASWLGVPINKQLWTASFVLWTSGWACVVFAACYAVADLRALGEFGRRMTRPFQIYGLNAIAAFFGSGMLARLLGLIKVGEGADRKPVLQWVFVHGFGVIPDPYIASVAFAIAIVLFWLGVLWVMARRGVFLKV